MDGLDRLHAVIDKVRPHQVHALLTLLQASEPISDQELARLLAGAPEEDVDEETAARIPAAETEPGEISYQELKSRLGL